MSSLHPLILQKGWELISTQGTVMLIDCQCDKRLQSLPGQPNGFCQFNNKRADFQKQRGQGCLPIGNRWAELECQTDMLNGLGILYQSRGDHCTGSPTWFSLWDSSDLPVLLWAHFSPLWIFRGYNFCSSFFAKYNSWAVDLCQE